MSNTLSKQQNMQKNPFQYQKKPTNYDGERRQRGGNLYSRPFACTEPSTLGLTVSDFRGTIHLHFRNKNGMQYLHMTPDEFYDILEGAADIVDSIQEGQQAISDSGEAHLAYAESNVHVIGKSQRRQQNERNFEHMRALLKKSAKSYMLPSNAQDETHVLAKSKFKKRAAHPPESDDDDDDVVSPSLYEKDGIKKRKTDRVKRKKTAITCASETEENEDELITSGCPP